MKVAVVILNWNGKGFLEKFLPSLFNSLPSYAELVVADNASTDGSKEAVNNEKIQWIQLDKNYGFTGGYNRAFEKLDGYKYYVLINSDIEITEGWLETLTDFMEKHPEVSACQPKILSYANKDHFEYAGAAGGFIDRWGFPLCPNISSATIFQTSRAPKTWREWSSTKTASRSNPPTKNSK